MSESWLGRSAVPVFAVLFGCLISLTLTGYQIGESNHTVYLLDGIRHADPQLFSKDWFTNSTLQYHGLFSYITRYSIQFGILRPVFLIGYLLTVLGFHLFTYRLARVLLGEAPERTAPRLAAIYLLTVVLFHLSAGGTGLGGFQFLQDSAFLPSNVSNVAMLAGIVFLMERRLWPAALALGLSGIFHINHAVFAGPVFAVGALALPNLRREWKRRFLAGLLVGALCLINLGPSLVHLADEPGGEQALSLAEFVQIYAKLRHPHHYYPRAWPAMVYIGALWTFIPAAWVVIKGARWLPETPKRVGAAIFAFLMAAAGLALLFAGVIFVSERLIQMAVFRFTIFPILLSCAVTAWGLFNPRLLSRRVASAGVWVVAAGLAAGILLAWCGVAGAIAQNFVHNRPAPFVFATVLVAAVAALAPLRDRVIQPGAAWAGSAVVLLLGVVGWNRWMGLNFLRVDPEPYTRLGHWARDHTPKDALFIVPPNDQAWRLASQRSILINFKAIPQTAREMPGWKQRMQDLTGVDDLPALASTFNDVLIRLDKIYTARPERELTALANKYDARYLVTAATYPDLREVGPPAAETAPFHLYDLRPNP